VINGHRSKYFKISWSMRQGCPMSAILYLFAMEVSDQMVSKAIKQKQVRGLEVETEGMALCQTFYADNTPLLIEADVQNAQKCMELGDTFGSISGLHFKWTGMKTVYTGGLPILQEYLSLGWSFEEPGNFSKLLGLHFGIGIDPDLMLTQVSILLDERLEKSKMDPTSIGTRLVIVKQLM
jgi:hypothetical protein